MKEWENDYLFSCILLILMYLMILMILMHIQYVILHIQHIHAAWGFIQLPGTVYSKNIQNFEFRIFEHCELTKMKCKN